MKQLFILVFISWSYAAAAQQWPAFKSLRYDEDYSFLEKDSSNDWYHKMKFRSLSENKKTYISLGGEIRYQYFYIQDENWGDEPADKDGYTLTRLLTHADFHTGNFRTFIQLQSSLANSRPNASPVDDNPLELHQAFVDYAFTFEKNKKMLLRFGRQELQYGSQRLIAVRDNPNNRQSFDALRGIYSGNNYRVDIFYGHYVAAMKNIFDDGFNKNAKLWGIYLVKNKVPVFKNIDLYYLGLWKRSAHFDDGTARELRHSIGSRAWNNTGNWKYDIEALYQFGKFGEKDIAAWTASVNASYKFSNAPLKPELGLKTEVISGDKNYDDDKLQTFNPLFPRGAYFGLAALIGPVNLIDVHPSVSVSPAENVSIDLEYDAFWRYSKNDALYAVNVSTIYSGRNIDAKYIGGQYSGSIIFKPNGFLYFRGEFTWFHASSFIKAAGAGKDIFFTGATAQLKF